jgi:hypothetical protein
MRRILIRLVAVFTSLSLAACSTLHTVADRRSSDADPGPSLQASVKPSDYLVLTFKDKSQAGITVSSVSASEIVGTHDGQDVQEHFKIEDILVVEKSERKPGRTLLLILGSAFGAVLLFLAIASRGFQG